MGKMGKVDYKGLKALQNKLNKLQDSNVFVEACAKELTARLLAKVIKRTPVGKYGKSTGKKGGTLRRGWTSKSYEEAISGKWSADSAAASQGAKYAQSLTINHVGNILSVEIVNPVEYASYVEYGHRTKNHKGWVKGRFMLTISEQEIQKIAPKVLENKIKKYLGGIMK